MKDDLNFPSNPDYEVGVSEVQRDIPETALAHLTDERDALVHTARTAEQALIAARARLGTLEAGAAAQVEELKRLQVELAAKDQRIAELQASLSQTESALAQQQEQSSQAWAELSAQQEGRAGLQQQIDAALKQCEEAERNLADANEWVFRLAGERREADQLAQRLRQDLHRADKALEKVEAALTAEKNISALRVARVEENIAVLETMLAERDAQSAERDMQLDEKDAAIRQMQVEKADNEARLNERFGEIAALTRMVQEKEVAARQLADQAEWMRATATILLGGSGSWKNRLMSLLPFAWRRSLQMTQLRRRGLFDPSAYLAVHADVNRAGADPLVHYIRHGLPEGRPRGMYADNQSGDEF